MAPRLRVPEPPRGWAMLAWLGPSFLWMVSAAGSGELLFSPRIGALYGYALVWALLLAVALKWVVNREVGRWAVCTGAPILEGLARLPGPRGWALWVVLGPQVVVAIATIAGLAGSAATALALVLPGGSRPWALASIGAAAALVVWGRYKVVERIAAAIAIALAIAALSAAFAVGPDGGAFAAGLVPGAPPETDWGEVLPWLGFALSGAAGIIWYSYWLVAKGYGAAGREDPEDGDREPLEPARLPEQDRQRLRGWLRMLTLDNTLAVVGVTVVMLAFLVLGAELLRPEGLVPEEERVAPVLGRLLGDVWGPAGFAFMVAALYVGFWTTVLSDQDGFGRMFAHGTQLLAGERLRGAWARELRLRRAFVLVLTTLLPAVVYLAVGSPVALLMLAGAIEAAHLPFLAALVLLLNRKLPEGLRPSRATQVLAAAAALFFAAFAVVVAGQALGWG